MSNQTIVITGASSGIGKATAKFFAEKGWNVAATMRTPAKESELGNLDSVKLYQLDVTDNASINSARDQILSDFGSVDIVLNNAGYGLMGSFEAATEEQIQSQFDTNVFGLMAVTRAFLPHFRAKSKGLFMNVSSVGGLATFPFISLYHSTKWAVEGFSEAISYELGEFGIQVKVIEPGAVATDFGSRSLAVTSQEGLTAYDELMGKVQAAWENMGANANTSEFLAEGIYAAATDGKQQLRYLIGSDAEQLINMRNEVGDDAFIAGIKEQMFG